VAASHDLPPGSLPHLRPLVLSAAAADAALVRSAQHPDPRSQIACD